jgi:ketosteroid isomerase-like protein
MTDSTEPTEAQVLDAAAAIVEAFAATDASRYFATFAPDATFVFHTEPERFGSRAAYEQVWAGWVESGWRVISCDSSDALVQTFPGGAVFTHTVDTTVDTGDGTESYRERETIVFRATGDAGGSGLIAVHEHLSPMPASADASD